MEFERSNRSSPSQEASGCNGGGAGDPFDNKQSRARYTAYSKLQASAVAVGERLPIPEIVAIGGQSDGKSSLLEALLGFRFNIREVEMGTRRPLILQMIHNEAALEPRCCLQDENSEDYGPVISPPSAVPEAIRRRTEVHLKEIGAAVSSKPIVFRVEYAFSPNLTIIDTPGFILEARQGEPEDTPTAILNMVKELAAAPHRLVLFLQQSSVEWCSSLWLKVAREVDPDLRRTVVVVSKFDNRLKEFSERWEVDRYLSAAGYLGDRVRPFFVALPKADPKVVATESAAEFRQQIAQTDRQCLSQLRDGVTGGFDEEQFASHIGFANLRRLLEHELQARYRDAAPTTLALLERRCQATASELALVSSRLSSAADVAALRRAAMAHTAEVAHRVSSMLEGTAASSGPDPELWGMTTEEEKRACTGGSGALQWPGANCAVPPTNANLRLFGGAAFARVMDEFKCAACSVDCPPVSKEKVANLLLCRRSIYGGSATAVTSVGAELGRAAAKQWLTPLLDTVCDRLAAVIRCLFDLTVKQAQQEDDGQEEEVHIGLEGRDSFASTRAVLAPYVIFHAAMRAAFDSFLDGLTRHCKSLARHHLATATSPYATLMVPALFPEDVPLLLHRGAEPSGPPAVEGGSSMEHRFPDKDDDADENEEPGRRLGPHLDSCSRRPVAASPAYHVHAGDEVREPLRESQVTVPETPSPDQVATGAAAVSKKREYGVASGRLGASSGPVTAAGEVSAEDHGTGRKRPSGASSSGSDMVVKTTALGNGRQRRPQAIRVPAPRGVYEEVCNVAADHFARIREVVVHQLVPATLNANFLTPCREHLSMSVFLQLFARPDVDFMNLFVAPGVVEALHSKREAIERRVEMFDRCKEEFRTIAHEI